MKIEDLVFNKGNLCVVQADDHKLTIGLAVEDTYTEKEVYIDDSDKLERTFKKCTDIIEVNEEKTASRF